MSMKKVGSILLLSLFVSFFSVQYVLLLICADEEHEQLEAVPDPRHEELHVDETEAQCDLNGLLLSETEVIPDLSDLPGNDASVFLKLNSVSVYSIYSIHSHV